MLPTPTFPGRAFIDVHHLETIATDSIQFASDSIDNLKWSLEMLIELLTAWPDILDSSDVVANYYKTVSSASFSKLMKVFYGMQTDTNTVILSSYLSTNSGVSPVGINEQNLQTVNNLYLTYFMAMPDSFAQTGNLMDSADLGMLYSVASQCYLPGGPAVFLARSMYWAAIRDNSIGFDDDCGSGDGEYKMLRVSTTEPTDSNYIFKVYPNPPALRSLYNNKTDVVLSLTGGLWAGD
jgi:hypothetical protein